MKATLIPYAWYIKVIVSVLIAADCEFDHQSVKPKIIKFVFLCCPLPRDMNIDYDLSVGQHLCW